LTDSSPKIFCVDDHPANLKLLKASLRDFDCVLLESGDACLEQLERELPDLILLDVMMPGIDGFETCRQIHSKHADKFLPVIFVSARDSIDDRLQGYAAGGDDYICKPFQQSELAAKVAAQLKRKAEFDRTRQQASVSETLLSNLQEISHVVNFLRNVLLLRSSSKIAELTIDTLHKLQLESVVQINFDGQYHISSRKPDSPLEQSVFDYIQRRGKLVRFGRKLAVNYPRITVIVQNLPLNDEELCGRIQDHLALIADGANSRLTVLMQDHENLQKYNMLIEFMSELKGILNSLDDSYNRHKKFSEEILASVSENMESAFMHMALTESQEHELRHIIDDAEDRIRMENDSFSGVHRQFSSMHRQIDTVLNHTLDSLQDENGDQSASEIVVLF
jgi:DNA-binding response OmpR family regulator